MTQRALEGTAVATVLALGPAWLEAAEPPALAAGLLRYLGLPARNKASWRNAGSSTAEWIVSSLSPRRSLQSAPWS